MARSLSVIEVYLELGSKRAFAGALDWPGWCRSGRDEASALQALFDYGPRYARVLRSARLGFQVPGAAAGLVVVERIRGDATTDFGAPGAAPSKDSRHFKEEELERSRAILRACWRAFDAAVEGASGKALRKGPRGGGRTREAIVEHVVDADGGYLGEIARKAAPPGEMDLAQRLIQTRREILEGLESAGRNGVPERGPPGGRLGTQGHVVRRRAWD